jgi:hypothetical protein
MTYRVAGFSLNIITITIPFYKILQHTLVNFRLHINFRLHDPVYLKTLYSLNCVVIGSVNLTMPQIFDIFNSLLLNLKLNLPV